MDNNINQFRTNFTKTFHNSVIPALKPFEAERIKARNKANLLSCIFATIAVIVMLVLLLSDRQSEVFISSACKVLFFGTILSCAIIVGVRRFIQKGFEFQIKEKIMPIALSAFGDFKWTMNEIISKYELKDSKIISHFENMDVDDNFIGSYKNIPINISEMHLYYKTKDSKGRTQTHTAFKGVAIKLEIPKHFKSHTIIKPKVLVNSGPYEEVKLEDTEFSKKFHVRSQDQVEARYLITTAFMERFKNIQHAFEAKTISCSFKDNTLLLAIPVKKDLFSLGDLNKPVTDTQQYEIFLKELISIFELIEELKLYQNTGL